MPTLPLVTIVGLAVIGGVIALIVLVAVYREILIHKRVSKEK